MRILLLTSLMVISIAGFSQDQHRIDSLKHELEAEKNVIKRLRLRTSLGTAQQIFRMPFWDSLRIEGEAIKDTSTLLNCLYTLGYLYRYHGNNDTAVSIYKRCLEISEIGTDTNWMGTSLTALGLVYDDLGLIDKSIECAHRSLLLMELCNDIYGLANCHMNLSALYYSQGTSEDIDKHLKAARAYYIEMNYWEGIATIEAKLAKYAAESADTNVAISHYRRSLAILDSINYEAALPSPLIGLSNELFKQNNYKESLSCLRRSYRIAYKQDDKKLMAASCNALAYFYMKKGETDSSYHYGLSAKDIAYAAGFVYEMSEVDKTLYLNAKKAGEFEHALNYFEAHIMLRDSLKNEATQKSTIRQQTKYEFEKKQLLNEQVEIEKLRIIDEEINRRDNLQYSVILISLLLTFAAVLSLGYIKASPKIAEGLIFFSFLILFEFVLVLADPTVDKWSEGAPGYKLLFNGILAGLIFPLHTFFESMLKSRLINIKHKK